MEIETSADIDNSEDKQPRKIGGWLFLVALGVIFAPLRLSFILWTTYLPILNDEFWTSIASETSDAYIPFFGSLLVGEVIINLIVIVASIYMAILFFQKKSSFPKWYAFIAIFSTVFILIDAYLVTLIMPAIDMFDIDTLKELSKSLFSCLVWTPYLFLSLRSKETFIR